MLQRLLEGMYMPHGYCLLWEPWLISLHAVSDFLIFAAYSAIPVAIWIFVNKRPNVEMRGLAKLFAGFILWCGLTHLFSIIVLWHPIYELQGLVKGATAAISVVTAVLIFPLIPQALAIPSPNELQIANSELEREIAAHKRTLAALEMARQELEQRVADRTAEVRTASERFKILFEQAPVAMLMVSADDKIEQSNAAAEALFVASRHELLGQSMDALLPPAVDVPSWRDAVTAHQSTHRVADERKSARRKDGELFPVEIGLNRLGGNGSCAIVVSIVDISARKREEERLQFIMRELSHRSKNLLAVIQGMVRQALTTSTDLQSFERSFTERLQGLARSHDLLVGKNWQGASIVELVDAQLSFLKRSDGSNVAVRGPDMILSPQAAQTLGLALHELATNAAKHGAFADPEGLVEISWAKRQGSDGDHQLVFVWQETAQRKISNPERNGFGRVVLEQIVPRSFGAEALLEFMPTGLRWQLVAPVDAIVPSHLNVAA